MEIEVNNKTEKELPFPKLMIDKTTNLIVLFSKYEEGMVIYRGESHFLTGYFDDGWNGKAFEDFRGEIKLSNKK